MRRRMRRPDRLAVVQFRKSRNAVTSASVARIDRYTNAWYWDGLGLGRPAGLHFRHTDRPHGTVSPHRTHRSYSPFVTARVYALRPRPVRPIALPPWPA